MSLLLTLAWIISPGLLMIFILLSIFSKKSLTKAWCVFASIVIFIVGFAIVGPFADINEFVAYDGEIKPVVYLDSKNKDFYAEYEFDGKQIKYIFKVNESRQINENTVFNLFVKINHYGKGEHEFTFKQKTDTITLKVIDFNNIKKEKPIEKLKIEKSIKIEKSNIIKIN